MRAFLMSKLLMESLCSADEIWLMIVLSWLISILVCLLLKLNSISLNLCLVITHMFILLLSIVDFLVLLSVLISLLYPAILWLNLTLLLL